jgi:hypothetical protein
MFSPLINAYKNLKRRDHTGDLDEDGINEVQWL